MSNKYVCANCNSPMSFNHGTVNAELVSVDHMGRQKVERVTFKGLGTPRCPKGCRKMRFSTNKGKVMANRNEQRWSFSPVATSLKATCKAARRDQNE